MKDASCGMCSSADFKESKSTFIRHMHKRKIYSVLFSSIIFLSSFFLSGCVNGLFYFPDNIVYRTPSERFLEYQDVFFSSRDGTKLHGWFLPAKKSPIGTVIHFHGNAQNLTAHSSFVDWLPGEGFNLFTFDYRGYGRSEGSPDRQGVYEDCIAAIEYIKTREDIDQEKILILGQSLGGTNAVTVLGKNRFTGIQAVVADSAFFSYRTIVRDKIGGIPLLSLLKWPLSYVIVSNKHSPESVIHKISPLPILLIHGTSDQVIPYHHSKWLFSMAKEPKILWTIEGGRHTEAFTEFGSLYRKRLVKFYKESLSKDR